MRSIPVSKKYKVIEELLRHYLEFEAFFRDTGRDIIVGGTHYTECPWWERVEVTYINDEGTAAFTKDGRPKELRNKQAECTCGFSEHGPLMLSFTGLQNALKGISKRKKEAIWYHVINDMLQREVAEIMGIQPVTVGQYVKAGMKQLEEEYFAELISDTNRTFNKREKRVIRSSKTT